MAVVISWTPKLSVSNDEIDKQHQGLIQLSNDLPETLEKKSINRIIFLLYKYTREHFKAEELLMKSVNYPDLVDHKVKHDELIDKLNNFALESLTSDYDAKKLKEFIQEWIIEHILGTDKQYAEFIQKKEK
jgi:hemerythrin-like metal-binding protein